jgi:hypothetical protein
MQDERGFEQGHVDAWEKVRPTLERLCVVEDMALRRSWRLWLGIISTWRRGDVGGLVFISGKFRRLNP